MKSKLDRELKWNRHVHRDYTYFWDALHTITRTTVVISLKILPFFAVSLTTGRRIKSSVGTSSRTPVVSSQWGWEEEKYTNSRRKDSTHLTTHIWYKTLHFLPPRFTTSPRQIYRNGVLQLSSTGIFLPCRQYPCERHFPVILRHRLLRTAAGSFISHCPADTFSIASADNSRSYTLSTSFFSASPSIRSQYSALCRYFSAPPEVLRTNTHTLRCTEVYLNSICQLGGEGGTPKKYNAPAGYSPLSSQL